MSTTHLMQSPVFMNSNPLLISVNVDCNHLVVSSIGRGGGEGTYGVSDVVVDGQLSTEVVIDQSRESESPSNQYNHR